MAKLAGILVMIFSLGVLGVWAQEEPQEETYRGFLDDAENAIIYELPLDAGQSVLLTAETTSGDLDPQLTLSAPDGRMLLSNDDRTPLDFDSVLGFTATEGGTYTVTVERSTYRFGETSGHFRLTIVKGGADVLEALEDLTAYSLSGREDTIETEHFVVHYTDRGVDAASSDYAIAVSTTFEEVWQIQIVEMRWPAPPPDSLAGGDGRYDVYIGDLINEYHNALGFTSPRVTVGDNPDSPLLETRASTSYIVVENDFEEVLEVDPQSDAISLMRSTVAHEFHHAIQLGYDYRDLHRWYYEATAVYMETATLIKEQDATDFVGYNFDYPELCFGTEVTDPGVGLLIYGDWLFIQSLVDAHGEEIVQKMWQNIAEYDGFEALEQTLSRYGDDVPTALARYRVKNLLRDYSLARQFDATVWLEDVIDDTGR
ncbi:MAG: MXAN_6640 family putative metalloprotease [Anaerolineae bacterium]